MAEKGVAMASKVGCHSRRTPHKVDHSRRRLILLVQLDDYLAQPRGGGCELPAAIAAAATRPGDTGERGQAAAGASWRMPRHRGRWAGRTEATVPHSLRMTEREGVDVLIDADCRPWQIQLHLWPIPLGPWDPDGRRGASAPEGRSTDLCELGRRSLLRWRHQSYGESVCHRWHPQLRNTHPEHPPCF